MLVVETSVGALLVLVFVYFANVSAKMPIADKFWTGSGAFPLIVSALLALCSAIWTAESFSRLKKAGIRREVDDLVKPLKEKSGISRLLRFLAALGLSLLYIFALIPWLKFVIATVIFLVVMSTAFGRLRPVPAVITSVAVTAGIYAAFRYVLMLPLP
ncbi:MAG: tripartite tricarboxylate transporter TctB family protein [Firmicutes bacterium]|nr:tripartite tricarboxylate transporter TctB family protein [Bacillota bacterium]